MNEVVSDGSTARALHAVSVIKQIFDLLFVLFFMIMAVDMLRLCWSLIHRSRKRINEATVNRQAAWTILFVYCIAYIFNRSFR